MRYLVKLYVESNTGDLKRITTDIEQALHVQALFPQVESISPIHN